MVFVFIFYNLCFKFFILKSLLLTSVINLFHSIAVQLFADQKYTNSFEGHVRLTMSC